MFLKELIVFKIDRYTLYTLMTSLVTLQGLCGASEFFIKSLLVFPQFIIKSVGESNDDNTNLPKHYREVL